MKSLVYVLLLLIFGYAALAANSVSPTETKLKIDQTKRQALQILDRKGFFKQGTCTDVANTFFESNGFPLLGQKELIKGTRGNFDRSSANQEPPIFTDEYTLNGIKTSMTAASSKEKKMQKWTLKIRRQGTTAETKKYDQATVLYFEVNAVSGRPNCDLLNFEIKFNDKGFPKNSLGASACLDLFLLDSSPEGMAKTYEDWVKKDCTTALHYSREAKEMLAEPPKK